MTEDTLTFEIGGQVRIDDLDSCVGHFHRLVSELSAGSAVTWLVEDLHTGSAAITIRAESSDATEVERVVSDYESIGQSLSKHERPQHPQDKVVDAALEIALLAESHEYIRLGTPYADYTIYANGSASTKPSSPRLAIGTVTGTVQTLISRARLKFNLYDTIHDKSVACYLKSGQQEELMRAAWGKRARVTGTVSREIGSGRPIAVRDILKIELLKDTPTGSYKSAKGALGREGI